MDEKGRVLPLQDFITATLSFEQVCREWIMGTLDDATFMRHYREIVKTGHAIAEISSDDDDFDWNTVPTEIMAACDEAHSYHGNVLRLIQAIRRAISELQHAPRPHHDPLIRAVLVGQFLRPCGVDAHRFLRSSRLKSLTTGPEPQPPFC